MDEYGIVFKDGKWLYYDDKEEAEENLEKGYTIECLLHDHTGSFCNNSDYIVVYANRIWGDFDNVIGEGFHDDDGSIIIWGKLFGLPSDALSDIAKDGFVEIVEITKPAGFSIVMGWDIEDKVDFMLCNLCTDDLKVGMVKSDSLYSEG